MKKRKHKKKFKLIGIVSIFLVIGMIVFFYALYFLADRKPDIEKATATFRENTKDRIDQKLLAPNKYSRPQIKLKEVTGVVIHYTANPGTDAIANRNYFNNLPKINKKQKQQTYASSNFIVGLKGDIINCVPETEVAYASNGRNYDTLSIECCHPNASGKFGKETYASLVWLTAAICSYYKLKRDDIIRHYDVTGKNCPKYFVANADKWEEFLDDVMEGVTYSN